MVVGSFVEVGEEPFAASHRSGVRKHLEMAKQEAQWCWA